MHSLWGLDLLSKSRKHCNIEIMAHCVISAVINKSSNICPCIFFSFTFKYSFIFVLEHSVILHVHHRSDEHWDARFLNVIDLSISKSTVIFDILSTFLR
jgi:hypothetical protein